MKRNRLTDEEIFFAENIRENIHCQNALVWRERGKIEEVKRYMLTDEEISQEVQKITDEIQKTLFHFENLLEKRMQLEKIKR